MQKSEIIALIQANPKQSKHIADNVFVPMTPEQQEARKASFIGGLKMNMFKLGQRASYKN